MDLKKAGLHSAILRNFPRAKKYPNPRLARVQIRARVPLLRKRARDQKANPRDARTGEASANTIQMKVKAAGLAIVMIMNLRSRRIQTVSQYAETVVLKKAGATHVASAKAIGVIPNVDLTTVLKKLTRRSLVLHANIRLELLKNTMTLLGTMRIAVDLNPTSMMNRS